MRISDTLFKKRQRSRVMHFVHSPVNHHVAFYVCSRKVVERTEQRALFKPELFLSRDETDGIYVGNGDNHHFVGNIYGVFGVTRTTVAVS